VNLTNGTGQHGDTCIHWTNQHVPGLQGDIVKVIGKKAEELRAILIDHHASDALYFYPYKGMMTRIPEDFNAYGRRDPGWICQAEVYVTGRDELSDERRAWVESFRTELAPLSYENSYLNSSSFEDIDQVRRFYGDQKFEKLQRIKAIYDPTNFFCHNFNIPPP
jgi:FAD/FMN-containing dehydrogenase